jgi:hypothetical protein
MTHVEYLEHVKKYLNGSLIHDNSINLYLQAHKDIYNIILNLNLDNALPILKPTYCPIERKKTRDPLNMLRSLILMTLLKIASITFWVLQTRSQPLLAILAGFTPDDIPGVGTYYDFMRRIINGPYQKPCPHVVKRSDLNSGLHRRNIKKESKEKKDNYDPYNSKSAILVKKLLEDASNPRPDDFNKIVEDLLFQTGILPSIQDNLLTNIDNMIVVGDGSTAKANASPTGKPTCSCRSEGIKNCEHPRLYSSPTAQLCYDHHHDCFVFGDRYYHLAANEDGHDYPLITIMPGGNESDYTLSLKAIDRFIKAANENGVNINISHFCGDGHHDSYAHYQYLKEKHIVPVIPLTHKGKKTYPRFDGIDAALDTDGTPLCPGGKRMRHHLYNTTKEVHVYTCPVKRNTHRNGMSIYTTHAEECPKKEICFPDSSLAPIVYIKSETDPRYFPPIDRNSKKFKEIMNLRSASERLNSVNDSYHIDGRCRNADYGLIRLNLINIVEHAAVRHAQAVKKSSEDSLFESTMRKIGVSVPDRLTSKLA